jgi:hypothetical protein
MIINDKPKDLRDKENWIYLKPLTALEQLDWSRVPSGKSSEYIKKWIEKNQNKDTK